MGLVKVPDQRLIQEGGLVNRSGLQVKSLWQMFRPWGFFCIFTPNTQFLFLVALVRLYDSVFVLHLVEVQMLVDYPMSFGAHLIFCACFHDSISEMGGMMLFTSLTECCLFVRVHSFATLCVMKHFHCFNRVQWGIADRWHTWSSNWQLGFNQKPVSFSADWRPLLVFWCSRDTDLFVFNYFLYLNTFNSLGYWLHIYPA